MAEYIRVVEFEAMSPPDDGNMRRVSVESYEILLERDAL